MDQNSSENQKHKNDQTFMKEIREAFESYDNDDQGFILKDRARILVDDMRLSIGLDKSNDRIFKEIWTILDENHNGQLEIEEFINQRHTIQPILSEPGDKMHYMVPKLTEKTLQHQILIFIKNFI